jgi:hypothetical protein
MPKSTHRNKSAKSSTAWCAKDVTQSLWKAWQQENCLAGPQGAGVVTLRQRPMVLRSQRKLTRCVLFETGYWAETHSGGRWSRSTTESLQLSRESLNDVAGQGISLLFFFIRWFSWPRSCRRTIQKNHRHKNQAIKEHEHVMAQMAAR